MNKRTAHLSIFREKINLSSFKYIIITLLIGGNFLHAQTRTIDSLEIVLSNTIAATDRIEVLRELSAQLEDIEVNRSLDYAKEVLRISLEHDDKENEIKALLDIGILVYESFERDSALAYFEEGVYKADKFGFKELEVDNLIRIVKWYRYHQVDSVKTVDYLMKSLEISKAANYDEGVGRSYAKLASFYTKYQQVDLCEKYLALSAKYYLKIKGGGEEIAHYYNEVGDKIWVSNPEKSMDFYLKGMEYSDIYPNLKVNLARVNTLIGKPEVALYYLQEAIPNIDKVEQKRMLGIAISQLVEVYLELGDFEAARKSCDEGIELLLPLGRSSQRGLPALYRAKGILSEHDGNNELALEFYEKSILEAKRVRFGFERVKSQLALGLFYSDKDPEMGKSYCGKAYRKAQQNKYTNIEIEACNCLYRIHKKENENGKALEYYEKKIALSDSLGMLRVRHAIEVNNRIAEKDKQLAEQSYQKEIREEQFKNQYQLNLILFLFSLIGLFLIGFLTLSSRKIKKQNIEIIRKTDELKEVNVNLARSNKELERFAYVASHDLKSPLRNIISFTELLRRTLDKEGGISPAAKKFLNFIDINGKRMNKLIVDILEYSKLSNEEENGYNQELIKLNELFDEIAQISLNNPNNKSTNIEISELPNLRWNASKIYLLFKNLIENGLKYNKSEKPTIKVYSTKENGIHAIYIEDNGIGIKQEYFDKIFIMFQRLHTQSEYEGTGLGLATCKKIVNEFNGEISMSSELGKGTIFKIELPNDIIDE